MKRALSNRKIQYIAIPIIVVIITSLILFGLYFIDSRGPGDLGTRLNYIGKTSSGCYFVCDGLPSNTYYFETDMTAEEMRTYFRKAQYIPPKPLGEEQTNYGDDYYSRSEGGEQEFVYRYNNEASDFIHLIYLKNKSILLEESGRDFSTKKPYFVEIVDYPPHYRIDWFKDAL